MNNSTTLQGIIAYPITPFRNGAVDTAALNLSLERLLENGADAIAPLGSTGESAYLTTAEWETVARSSIECVGGRIPVIIGVSDLTTEAALAKARLAEKLGASCLMLLVKAYWKLSESEIARHVETVAGGLSIPVMLYNNPATSGVDLSPELLVELAGRVEQVTMIKESTGDIRRMHRIHQLSEGRLPFYNGCNPLALEALAAGASGWCTAAHNLIPQHTVALFQAASQGRLEEARRIFYEQLELLTFLLGRGLPATIKAGLRLLGCEVGDPRQPLHPLDSQENDTLRQLLRGLSVLS